MSTSFLDPGDARAIADLRHLAEQAARAGGAVARARYETDLNIRLKADRSEVSDADEAAQRAIIDMIQAARPDDSFIGEEQLDTSSPPPPPTNNKVCWVIDPIDGTRNYIRRMGDYSTCVAAMHGGMPIVGVVYDPQRDRLYSAARGEDLTVNGVAIRHDKCEKDAKCPRRKVLVGVPSTATDVVHGIVHDWMDRFVVRNYGSTAIHLALVAAGQLDAAISANSKLWDIAAGWMLVVAGGGRMTSPTGPPLFPMDVSTYRIEEMPTLAISGAADDRISITL
ncbi:MAG: inositol monophosphatase [Phycisphaerae bacterium]|nr:inositol monophosphatase [Phycisphaerae bacterium]